jgi:hypothetical protein
MISLFLLFIFRVRNLSTSLCRFFIAGRKGHCGDLISGFMSIKVSSRAAVGARASPSRRLAFFITAPRLGS